MDYQQSRAYVKDADRYAGGALDLTNIKELMKRLGNPQDQLKYVHVAGTNGKGSVIASSSPSQLPVFSTAQEI